MKMSQFLYQKEEYNQRSELCSISSNKINKYWSSNHRNIFHKGRCYYLKVISNYRRVLYQLWYYLQHRILFSIKIMPFVLFRSSQVTPTKEFSQNQSVGRSAQCHFKVYCISMQKLSLKMEKEKCNIRKFEILQTHTIFFLLEHLILLLGYCNGFNYRVWYQWWTVIVSDLTIIDLRRPEKHNGII